MELFINTILLTIVQAVGMDITDDFLERLLIAAVVAVAELTWLYSKRKWREVVDPDHVIGLGLASVALFVLLYHEFSTPADRADWTTWAFLGLGLLMPTFLISAAALEIRRRAGAEPPTAD